MFELAVIALPISNFVLGMYVIGPKINFLHNIDKLISITLNIYLKYMAILMLLKSTSYLITLIFWINFKLFYHYNERLLCNGKVFEYTKRTFAGFIN